jgi:hypothetical protein
MAESRLINNEDNYVGVYPTVFKKIDSADVMVNPFQVHKSFSALSGSATSSLLPLQAIYTDINRLPALGSELTYNDAANIDGSLQSITYFAINHLYYKYKKEPSKTYGPTDLTRTKKHLYQSASIFAIPQQKFGEGIKLESLTIKHNSGNIFSDRYGNLVDGDINTGSFAPTPTWYEGFNEYFDTSRIKYISSGVTYVPGVPDADVSSLPVGLAAKFDGAGYIESDLTGFYDRDHDYAIAFWISGSSASTNLIATKASSSLTPQYPFRIELSGSNQIVFSAAGSTTFKTQITSSQLLTSWNHVVCQKSGSGLQIYVNGILDASGSSALLTNTMSPFTASARIDNADKLYIGGFSPTSSNLIAVLDEVRVFNKSLDGAAIVSLATPDLISGTFLQTNHIGNVFSKQGIAVISTPDYRFDNSVNDLNQIYWKSTVTIHELSVIAKLDSSDFNMSTNLTLTRDDDSTYLPFVSGSAFAPYITTIGLYNDAGELLAIGKLAQPVKKRNDVDMNFLIRIDLDKNIVKG